jgi:hypothetical protein
MYLKTSPGMPVHGSDGIHLRYDETNDELILYLGESKLYKDISAASTAAIDSILQFTGSSLSITNELRIVRRYLDMPTLSESARGRILEYLDPYGPLAVKQRTVHVCFLGFEFSAYQDILKMDPAVIEVQFRKKYEERIASISEMLSTKCTSKLATINIHFFLVPFVSLDELRKSIFREIGDPKCLMNFLR